MFGVDWLILSADHLLSDLEKISEALCACLFIWKNGDNRMDIIGLFED